MAENNVTLRIVVPDATINYIKNPSFRYDTNEWNVQGATLTRTLERARFSVASGKVVTAGSSLNEGVYSRVSDLDGISDEITVSAYVRGSGVVRIRLDDNSVGGAEYASQPVHLSPDRWTRLTVSGRSHGGNDLRMYVETAEGVAVVRTFYVDGAQMERKPYPTTYCDGDQDDCQWQGIYHDSSSERLANTRAGGRWVELSGPDREAEDLYMTVAGGLGVAPINNNTQDFALAPGGYHQSVKVRMRTITFTFHARHQALLRNTPVNLEKLHALRQMLIDVIKSDLTPGDQDILFEYRDGDVPLYFRGRYDGGLEGDWDVRNGWVNSFPLRLLAVDPFLDEDGQEAQELDFSQTLYPNFVAGRIDGEWNILNYGFDSNAVNFAKGRRGEIYACGNFTLANNDALAVNPFTAAYGLAYWDGESWVSLIPTQSGGLGFTVVTSVDVAPNGYIYVAGQFTTINGVAANYVAYYDGTNWNAMGTGLGGVGSFFGHIVKILSNGDVYVGGSFTSAGGVSCFNIARWDGSSFHRLGQYGGLNGDVFAIEASVDEKTLYIGGNFTDEQGFATNKLLTVASYDIASGQFSAMGAGFTWSDVGTASIEFIRRTRSGRLIASGRVDASGTGNIDYIAEFVGDAWIDIGSGIVKTSTSVVPYSIGELRNSVLFIAGTFDKFGDTKVTGTLLFNGSTFTPMDMQIKFFTCLASLSNYDSEDIFIAPQNQDATNSFLKCSSINTVNNPGTAECGMRFYIKGPGTLRWIENQTTKRTVFLNLPITTNEEVVIDTEQGTITSSLRASLLQYMLSGSDLGSLRLAPGDNRLACFIQDDVGAQMSIQFNLRHWSSDAAAFRDTA